MTHDDIWRPATMDSEKQQTAPDCLVALQLGFGRCLISLLLRQLVNVKYFYERRRVYASGMIVLTFNRAYIDCSLGISKPFARAIFTGFPSITSNSNGRPASQSSSIDGFPLVFLLP